MSNNALLLEIINGTRCDEIIAAAVDGAGTGISVLKKPVAEWSVAVE